jgi:hypothetical protein
MPGDLNAGLVHFWPMSEIGDGAVDRLDTVGGWDLSGVGALYGIDIAGKHGTAAEVSGTNGYFDNNAITTPSDYTFAGWVRGFTGLVNNYTIHIRTADSSAFIGIGIEGIATQQVRFDIKDASQQSRLIGVTDAADWNFIAVRVLTSGADHIVHCRVNDSDASTITVVGSLPVLTVFRGPYSHTASTTQAADELGFWDRSITDTELDWLYQSGAGNFYESGAWTAGPWDAPTNGVSETASDGLVEITNGASETASDGLGAPENGASETASDGLVEITNGASETVADQLGAPENGASETASDELETIESGVSETAAGTVAATDDIVSGVSETAADELETIESGISETAAGEVGSIESGVSETATGVVETIESGVVETATGTLETIESGVVETRTDFTTIESGVVETTADELLEFPDATFAVLTCGSRVFADEYLGVELTIGTVEKATLDALSKEY